MILGYHLQTNDDNQDKVVLAHTFTFIEHVPIWGFSVYLLFNTVQ